MYKTIRIPTQIAENEIARAKLTDHDTGYFPWLLHLNRLQVIRQNTLQLRRTNQIPRQTLRARLHIIGNLPQHRLLIAIINRFRINSPILH